MMEFLDNLDLDMFVKCGKDVYTIIDEINDYFGRDVFDDISTEKFVCYLRSKGYRVYEVISYIVG